MPKHDAMKTQVRQEVLIMEDASFSGKEFLVPINEHTVTKKRNCADN